MYQKRFYEGKDEKIIAQEIKKEGFDPSLFSDPPGRIYSPHKHPEIKLLAFLAGEMEVRVGGKTYQCSAGDKLIIPGDVEHSAVVGSKGCKFFWSER